MVLAVIFRGESLEPVLALGAAIATLGIVLTGLVLGAAFIVLERRSADPLLPFAMLRNSWLTLAMAVACLTILWANGC